MQFSIKTQARNQFIDITQQIKDYLAASGIKKGLLMVFIPHTTAAVTINESADPHVMADMKTTLDQLVPVNPNYRHSEGNSDSHVKSTLVGASECIEIKNNQLVLGTWQGIFFCEFDGPRTRKVNITILPS